VDEAVLTLMMLGWTNAGNWTLNHGNCKSSTQRGKCIRSLLYTLRMSFTNKLISSQEGSEIRGVRMVTVCHAS